MSFVDELLKQLDTLSAAEIVEIALDNWSAGNHGITEQLSDSFPQFIQDLLHIIDFDIACNWRGLAHFIIDCDYQGYMKTIAAFNHISAHTESAVLVSLLDNVEIGRIHAGYRVVLSEQTKQWVEKAERDLYFHTANAPMWDALENYIEVEKRRYLACV